MTTQKLFRVIVNFAFFAFFAVKDLPAQEKLTVSYSSVDAPSANWYIAQEKGMYKKYGLDVTLKMGGPQVNNVQMLAAGQAAQAAFVSNYTAERGYARLIEVYERAIAVRRARAAAGS